MQMTKHRAMSTLTQGLAVLVGCICFAANPMRAPGQSSPAETQAESNHQQAAVSDQQIPSAIARELDAMKKRIAQLEAELKQHQAAEQPTTAIHTAKAPVAPAATVAPTEVDALLPASGQPAKKQPAEPF